MWIVFVVPILAWFERWVIESCSVLALRLWGENKATYLLRLGRKATSAL